MIEIQHDDQTSTYMAQPNLVTKYATQSVLRQGFGHPAEFQSRDYEKEAGVRFTPSVSITAAEATSRSELAEQFADLGVTVAHEADSFYDLHLRRKHQSEITERNRRMARCYKAGGALLATTVALQLTGHGYDREAFDAGTLTGIGSLYSYYRGFFQYGTVKRGLQRRGQETTPGTSEQAVRDQDIREYAAKIYANQPRPKMGKLRATKHLLRDIAS